MENGTYKIGVDRVVYLSRFSVWPTFEGLIEASPSSVTQQIFRRLPKRVAEILPPGTPLLVVPCDQVPLPQWTCIAKLESQSGARNFHSDYGSHLIVVWFTDRTDQSIDEMIQSVLPHVQWERYAEGWPRFYRYENALFMRKNDADVGHVYIGNGEYRIYSDPDYRTFGSRIDEHEAKQMMQQIDAL